MFYGESRGRCKEWGFIPMPTLFSQRSWFSLSSWAAFQAVRAHVSDVTFSNCGCLALSLRDRWVTPTLWGKDNTDENLCSAQTSVLNKLMLYKSNFWRKTSILPFAGWLYVIFCVCLWLRALMLFFFSEKQIIFSPPSLIAVRKYGCVLGGKHMCYHWYVKERGVVERVNVVNAAKIHGTWCYTGEAEEELSMHNVSLE